MQEQLIEMLSGRHGHFQMESGFHSEWWFDLNQLFDRPERLRPFVTELANRLAAHRVEIVCGPMTGGAKLAELVGAELKLPHVAVERIVAVGAGGMFPVNYLVPASAREQVRGKRIAIVDDAMSAGSAARGTHADLIACGAQPMVFGALFVFGNAMERFATEQRLALEGIVRMEFNLWKPDECPHCRAGRALEKVSDG